MSDAPGQIWAMPADDDEDHTIVAWEEKIYGATEYVRADLFAAVVAERDAAYERAADVADKYADAYGITMRAAGKKERHDWQSMLMAAVDIRFAIRALKDGGAEGGL